MTQKSKLEILEKKFERVKPYKPNFGIFKAGKEKLTYIWRVFKTTEIMEIDGASADVKWIEEAKPSQAELLEIAEIANMVGNVEILWEELEE